MKHNVYYSCRWHMCSVQSKTRCELSRQPLLLFPFIQSVVVYLISIQQVTTVLNNDLPSPLKRAVSSLCSVETRRRQSLFSAWRMAPGSLTPPKSIAQSLIHQLGRLHIVDYALSIVQTHSVDFASCMYTWAEQVMYMCNQCL